MQKTTASVPSDLWCVCIYSTYWTTMKAGLRHSFSSIQFEALCNNYVVIFVSVNKLWETVYALTSDNEDFPSSVKSCTI